MKEIYAFYGPIDTSDTFIIVVSYTDTLIRQVVIFASDTLNMVRPTDTSIRYPRVVDKNMECVSLCPSARNCTRNDRISSKMVSLCPISQIPSEITSEILRAFSKHSNFDFDRFRRR